MGILSKTSWAAAAMCVVVGCSALRPAPATTEPASSPTPSPAATTAGPLDPRAAQCGVTAAGSIGAILGMFAVDHASHVRDHVPAMLKAPELDDSIDPAFVVLFDGPVKMPAFGGAAGGPTPPPFETGVMCVVVDGQPTFYTGVDTTGWRP